MTDDKPDTIRGMSRADESKTAPEEYFGSPEEGLKKRSIKS